MMIRLLFLISFIVSISSYLYEHNKARASIRPRLKPLQISSALVKSSQKYANYLCANQRLGLKHSKKGSSYRAWSTGENMGGHGNIAASVRAFIAEKSYWRNGRCQSGKICGHYTQVISGSTNKVGCAVKKCRGGGMSGRVVCQYTGGVGKGLALTITMEDDMEDLEPFQVDPDNIYDALSESECGEGYNGNMCLYANGADSEPMRFALWKQNGCDYEGKLYKHVDAADNSYYLHSSHHALLSAVDGDNATESEQDSDPEQWVVSRDYVSDIAHFWCDDSNLLQCQSGRWSKNVFEEEGVFEEIDVDIIIKKCPYNESENEQEGADGAVIAIVVVLSVLAVIIIVGAIYFIHRSRKKKSRMIKHLELEEEDEADGEEQTIQIEQDVTAQMTQNVDS